MDDQTPPRHALPEFPDPARLAVVAQHTANGVVMTDARGCIEWVNPAFEHISGYRLREIIGQRPGELLQGEETDQQTVTAMRQKLQAGEGFDRDILNYRKDGSPYWARVICSPISRDEHPDGGFFSVQLDITHYKADQRRLKISASVFERSHDAIMVSDSSNRIVEINPAFTRITGYERDEVIGTNPSILSSGRQGPEFYQSMWRSIVENNFWRGEIWNRRKNGEEFPEFLTITRVILDEPGDWYHVASFSDITALKNHAEELDRAANYDELTNLPNRRLMMERLRRAMDHSDQSGKPLAVCYLDLDGFKAVNDLVGQGLADRTLATVANRLRLAIRSDDTVARVGGDEFVLLLRDVDDERVYQRILDAIRQPLSVGPANTVITASMGVALYPNDPSDEERLVRHADQAMYSAKEKGRNNFHFFDPSLDEHLQQRRTQLTNLTRALNRNEFELHFQPQVRMSDRCVLGFEALARWRHPDQGLVPPGLFLPYIEGSHLEQRFGQWVLTEALQQQLKWFRSGYRLGVSINISPAHLLAPAFVGFLKRYLDAHPEVDPSLITLEILESTALDDIQRAGQVIQACRGLGIQVALDDFGTGFSSLSYFRSLPVDLIKIDQSFIRNMLEDDSDRAIVESVIYMAQRFSRSVLAEGVETREHAAALLAMGCDLIQGYGIARPLPATEVIQWMQHWSPEHPAGIALASGGASGS